MIPDDPHSSHNHGFELPETPVVVVRKDTRPWRALAGVAVCLGLAGVVTGIVVAHRQRVSDAHLTSDALQREELRDGWKALGAAAAQDARTTDVQPSAPANSAAAPPNVVIVNVPAQSATSQPPNVAPSNVTNITLPSTSAGAADAARLGSSGQSLPPVTYSPVQGYMPTPGGGAASPATDTSQPTYAPPIVYGTNGPSGAAANAPPVYTPPVGNGSIPGSTPNPALPNNNGLVGSTPTPGQPNGPVNGSSAPSSPSGFSVP
jgi:hypothetical protein